VKKKSILTNFVGDVGLGTKNELGGGAQVGFFSIFLINTVKSLGNFS